MTTPNMATITASLERSLQNFSLDNQGTISSSSNSNSSGGRVVAPSYAVNDSSESGSSENAILPNGSSSSSSSSIEFHSETPLPYFWERCLDLKTGEIYYINWKTGMRSEEDPRKNLEMINAEYYNSEDDSCSYESEGYSSSYSESSSPSIIPIEKDRCQNSSGDGGSDSDGEEQILVVTGCKSCLMYFMVPKQVEECPKCCGQLLHFDR